MIKNILFDWSGVISNDLLATFQTYNLLFKHYGAPEISLAEFQETFELPYSKFVVKHIPKVPIPELQVKFREFFPTVAHNPHPIPGVHAILTELHRRQILMAVLSSHSFVKREAADFFRGDDFFCHIFEDVPNKEEIVHYVIEKTGFKPKETLYVGDMVHDIEAGKKAGVVTAGILTGYQSKLILEKANPDFIFSDLSQVFSAL